MGSNDGKQNMMVNREKDKRVEIGDGVVVVGALVKRKQACFNFADIFFHLFG